MPVLPMSAARVFFDGVHRTARRASEGVAIHADGTIWCGTEWGDIIRIAADGSHELMGSTNGFALGLAFDSAGNRYVCDLKHAAVFKYDAATKQVGSSPPRASSSQLPVVDEARRPLCLRQPRQQQYRPGRLSLRPADR